MRNWHRPSGVTLGLRHSLNRRNKITIAWHQAVGAASKRERSAEASTRRLRAALRKGVDSLRRHSTHGVAAGTKGFVYAIRNTSTDSVKIGFTKQAVEQRLRKLQQGSDALLEVIGSRRADCSEERRLHKQCNASRVCGEWFSRSSEVNAAVEFLRADPERA